jgi:hypothetical protein
MQLGQRLEGGQERSWAVRGRKTALEIGRDSIDHLGLAGPDQMHRAAAGLPGSRLQKGVQVLAQLLLAGRQILQVELAFGRMTVPIHLLWGQAQVNNHQWMTVARQRVVKNRLDQPLPVGHLHKPSV